MNDSSVVSSVAALEALYAAPSARAASKPVTELNETLQRKIEKSSLCVIASVGPQGVDCSPRGDAPGDLVKVLDANTLAIPDRPGSNRLDTARNVIANGHIGLWFLSSESKESVRVMGNAHISTDTRLLDQFVLNEKRPVTVLVVRIHQVALHNDRAIRRSGLFD